VSTDWRGTRGDGPDSEGPPDGPDDSRPYGSRPYGSRPYGSRPYGSRPYGSRPYGSRPYGSRPYGSRPYGSRPYGSRPYGSRPYGSREEEASDGFLDPDEWSEDVADLFCGSSAVVQLGARVVTDGGDLPVAAVEPVVGTPLYMKQPAETDPAKDKTPQFKASQEKPRADVSERHLRPRKHELAVKVVVPNDLVRTFVEQPETAWAIKQDLARALAFRADQAFLHGDGGDPPLGITNTAAVARLMPPGHPPQDLLKVIRRMVGDLRRRGPDVQWGHAGWILHPNTLDGLSRLLTQNFENQLAPGWSLEPGLVFTHDGTDGGVLFGYPFIVSAATHDAGAGATRIHLSSDWSEAWVAVDRDLATVSISVDAAFQTDETVIRTVINHDFVLRRPAYFIYADRPPGVEPVELAGGVDIGQN
jgi:HK97 family phage major capsid protein